MVRICVGCSVALEVAVASTVAVAKVSVSIWRIFFFNGKWWWIIWVVCDGRIWKGWLAGKLHLIQMKVLIPIDAAFY